MAQRDTARLHVAHGLLRFGVKLPQVRIEVVRSVQRLICTVVLGPNAETNLLNAAAIPSLRNRGRVIG